MRALTVKQLARAACVSVRTLHHYDEIGLLKPAHIGANGYRYYGREEMLRLQQILFHREFGFALDAIATLIDESVEARIERLTQQKSVIAAEAKRQCLLVRTIDRAIAELRGEMRMKPSELYKGITPEKQAEYEQWLIERCGPGMDKRIADSKRHLAGTDMAERMAKAERIGKAIAARMQAGVPAEAAELDPLLERHRDWVAAMWGRPCPPEAFAGLGDLYGAHPDFRSNFEAVAEGYTDYLIAAMKAHAARHG